MEDDSDIDEDEVAKEMRKIKRANSDVRTNIMEYERQDNWFWIEHFTKNQNNKNETTVEGKTVQKSLTYQEILMFIKIKRTVLIY